MKKLVLTAALFFSTLQPAISQAPFPQLGQPLCPQGQGCCEYIYILWCSSLFGYPFCFEFVDSCARCSIICQ